MVHKHRLKRNSIYFLASLSYAIATISPIIPAAAQLAETANHPILDRSLLARINIPTDIGRSGSPRKRVIGGSRDTCPKDTNLPAIVALVPSTIFGFTTQVQPTLWFYLPYLPGENLSMEFELQDEQHKTKQTLPLTLNRELPGIISLKLPQEMALEPNREYRWLLHIRCGSEAGSVPDTLMGIIQRRPASPELEHALNQAVTPRERWIAYAEAGIWFDALTELGTLYRADADNPTLQQDWNTLLSVLNVGFKDPTGTLLLDADPLLAKQSLRHCCSLDKSAKTNARQVTGQ